MFLHSDRCRGVPVYSGLQYPKFRVISLGFRPGREVLEFVWLLVPYTLALSSKRSRPVVRPAVRSTAALFCRPVASQAPTAGWLSVLALLSSSN